MCIFGSSVPDPKLPRQPIKKSDPADFAASDKAGFGQSKGRSGARSLRIRRQSGTGFGNVSAGTGPVRIGAQVPA